MRSAAAASGASSAPTRSRPRVRPTELGLKGLLLLGALVIAFLAASYSNLFFLIIAFCAVLGLTGLVWSARNTAGVTLRLADVPAAPAGADRPVVLAITSRRAAFDLTVTLEFDDSDNRSPPIELAHIALATGERPLECVLPGQERGLRRIARVHCSSRYPFGLFRVTRSFTPDTVTELVTYPSTNGDARGPRFGRGALTGDDGTDCGGRSAAIAGLRPFRTGDGLGDMHWKASARRGEPVVKEREPGGQDIEEQIVVDRRCSDPAEFELRLADATAAVFRAHESERPLRLVSQGFEAAVEGGRDLTPVLRWLAGATPAQAAAGPPRAGHRNRDASEEPIGV